jgi:hypothetical protein
LFGKIDIFLIISIISCQNIKLSTNNEKNMLVMEDICLSFSRVGFILFRARTDVFNGSENEEISSYAQQIHWLVGSHTLSGMKSPGRGSVFHLFQCINALLSMCGRVHEIPRAPLLHYLEHWFFSTGQEQTSTSYYA